MALPIKHSTQGGQLLPALASSATFAGLLLIYLCVPALALAGAEEKPSLRLGVDTWRVECDYGTQGQTWMARGKTLTSPDGRNRAYVEIEVVQLASRMGAACRNTSKLLLSTSGNNEFRIRYMEEPTQCEGNGIRLVDWSKNSKALLFQVNRWIYESDACEGGDLLLYSAETQRFKLFTIERVSRWFSTKLKRDCVVDITPLGFSEDGDILFEADDNPWMEEECFSRPAKWLLHNNGNLEQLPDDYRVNRYGRFQAQSLID